MRTTAILVVDPSLQRHGGGIEEPAVRAPAATWSASGQQNQPSLVLVAFLGLIQYHRPSPSNKGTDRAISWLPGRKAREHR
jgi:hypothetical protein